MLVLRISLFTTCFILSCTSFLMSQVQQKVLLIDGQNDHSNWKQTTEIMKNHLEETGLFSVEVITNYPSGGGALDSFKPDFSNYDVVVSNYNGYQWPEDISRAFEEFVKNGGGLVVIHAANNAFPDWPAYKRMIGVGSGGAPELGPIIYYDEAQGKQVRENGPAQEGNHTEKYPVRIKTRNKNHPITKGLPASWMHEEDEIYTGLRGQAQDMEVLATAYSPVNQKGSGQHEPVLMVINYGKGRVFHVTLGHDPESQKGVGFITILQRGTEWAATGKVSQKIPEDFPGPDKGRKRP